MAKLTYFFNNSLKDGFRVYEPSNILSRFYRILLHTRRRTTVYHSYFSSWFYKNMAYREWGDGSITWVELLTQWLNRDREGKKLSV
jgi:hypothetical protein